MSLRNLDLVKWIGAGGMLVDHIWLYVFGATWWSEAAGALAFPLFTIALAEGVRNQHAASRERTLVRLLIGASVAQIAVLAVRDALPLNVIFTLAAGVWLDTCWRDRAKVAFGLAVASVVVGGFVVEYNHIGPFFVFVVMRWSATRRELWLALAACGLVALAPWNTNHFALAAPFIVLGVQRMAREVPRLPQAFYVLYAAQWPAIAVLAMVLGSAGLQR